LSIERQNILVGLVNLAQLFRRQSFRQLRELELDYDLP
jgi:hypothetical protein